MMNVLVDWLSQGLYGAAWWQIAVYTLVLTHLTVASVTLYLHRSQAHRAVAFAAGVSHFFRFWLWLTTGMVTREWVAVHRLHHAKCETTADPHSPLTKGLRNVLTRGAELYQAEASNAETREKYGHGTPEDWFERNMYARFPRLGISLMLVLDVVLFGAVGLTVWAVQMAWIPVFGGVINGIGHAMGYRNFEAQDNSCSIMPWGILIGGEELHNNHHTYPTSASFAVRRYEFDIGWLYILTFQRIGLASVRKLPPRISVTDTVRAVDETTLQALIAHRHEMLARYGRSIRAICKAELAASRRVRERERSELLRLACQWLARDPERVPPSYRAHLDEVRDSHVTLDTMVRMREELRQLWLCTTRARAELVVDLQSWCARAEASGIQGMERVALLIRRAKA